MQPFRATLKDVPRILVCAREFTALLGIKLNEPHYVAYWRQNLLSGCGAMFLLEHERLVVGGIGGTLIQQPLTGDKVAVEAFWYVKEEQRGGSASLRLHSAFEEWGWSEGADSVAMIFMEASMPQRLKGYYQRRGYDLLETVWQKKRPVCACAP